MVMIVRSRTIMIGIVVVRGARWRRPPLIHGSRWHPSTRGFSWYSGEGELRPSMTISDSSVPRYYEDVIRFEITMRYTLTV